MIDLKRRLLGHVPLLKFDGGGAGNSNPTTNTKTENADLRVVGGNDSVNTSSKLGLTLGDGSHENSISVVTADYGAVSAALKLALAGIEGANHTTDTALQSAGGLLDGALHNGAAATQQYVDTLKDIKTSDVRVLVIAGLAVVGLGAAFVFKGK